MIYDDIKKFTLQKICISAIVKNFDRFYFAFTISKDVAQQQRLEFLQKRFSDQLATELYKAEKLKDLHLKFLLNEHLTFLDGKWLKNSHYQTSIEYAFRRLPNLTRINFRECNDEILEIIAKYCPKIAEIDLSLSDVTDNGVKFLCERKSMIPCPEIKVIFIRGSRVTDKGVECLIQNLPSLERFDYTNMPKLLHSIHKENWSKFKKVRYYNLVEVDLLGVNRDHSYTDILKTCLSICPKLESLSCYISDKEQLNLFNKPHLKKMLLKFESFGYDPTINLDDFLKINGRNLIFLEIHKCIISVPVLAIYCPVLKELEAHNVSFIDGDNLQTVFNCLIKCSFVRINPPVAKLLTFSPNVETISFRFGTLSLDMKTQILKWCKNPSAKTIHFRDINLQMIFLRDILLSCPTLKEMWFNRCTFDDDGTEELLLNFAKNLSNKPSISFTNYLSSDDEYLQDILREAYRLRYEATGEGLKNYQFFI